MKTHRHVIPQPFTGYVINSTYVDHKGVERMMYTGETPEECMQRNAKENPNLVTDVGLETILAGYYQSLVTEAKEVDQQRYNHLLDVLPPCRWHRSSIGDIFHVSERITGNLVTWCGSLRGKFYEFVDFADADMDHLREKISKAFHRRGRHE